ncbi:S1 family peptidase [Actinoplanes sp. G11-F43]|uniref:S1 family peptidase n=1 Tax=Actinoplanes sp. G11-F43 TaxID=3424130 RepID=UPI003D34886D
MCKILAFLTVLAVGALTGSPAQAGVTALVPSIANGDLVPDGRYPFAVKITATGIPTPEGGKRDSSCSGGLISPRWIITAAHCFRDVDGKRVSRTVADKTTATVGRANLNGSGGVVAKIVQVKQHGKADVALARLDRPVVDITPLKLNREKPRQGQKARLVGYGFTAAGATKTPNRARTGRFEVTSVASTEMGLSGIAPKANTSPCERDSGGPYFVEDDDGTAVVIGVVSRGPSCPHTGPDTATRVDAMASWIRSIIKNDKLPSPSAEPPAPPKASESGESGPAGATPPSADPVSSYSPVLLAAIPAAAIGFVALLLAGARKNRRRRGNRRRR